MFLFHCDRVFQSYCMKTGMVTLQSFLLFNFCFQFSLLLNSAPYPVFYTNSKNNLNQYRQLVFNSHILTVILFTQIYLIKFIFIKLSDCLLLLRFSDQFLAWLASSAFTSLAKHIRLSGRTKTKHIFHGDLQDRYWTDVPDFTVYSGKDGWLVYSQKIYLKPSEIKCTKI